MNDINLTPTNNTLYFKPLTSKTQLSKHDTCDGYILTSNEKECRRIIDSLKGGNKKIAVMGGDNHFNRRVLETMNVDYLVNPEGGNKKDTLKQRDSGLNHVLTKIATKRKVAILTSTANLKDLDIKTRAQRISRIIQNIAICKKTNTPIKLVSLTTNKKNVMDSKARQALGLSFGMSSKQAEQAVRME